MNRGIAQRSVFETRRDMRYFTALLGRAVRRGELAVLAFCLMQNHFHLLVCSLRGELSRAMRRILSVYVQYFNRTRHRDGALFRGRFLSKPAETAAYRRILVRYIDDNPVSAGLADTAQEYPWGSARLYARRRGPLWLDRSWVESEVCRHARTTRYAPADYETCFPSKLSPALRQLVEHRIAGRAVADEDELEDLLAANTPETLDWLERRAWAADQTRPGQPALSPALIDEALSNQAARAPDWYLGRGRKCMHAPPVARVGLLRDVAGCSVRDIAGRVGLPHATVHHRLRIHADALESDDLYRALIASATREALAHVQRGAGPDAGEGS